MKNDITKTLSTVFILTAISKVLGFLRDAVFANLYGIGIESAAYHAAIKIPTQIVDIVLSSAIVSCFVPIFNEVMQKKGKDDANKFASNFINIVSTVATFIAIIGIIFAPLVVKSFTEFNEQAYNLTVELVRITFPMIIFTAMAFSFVGFLQSYGEFNVPAFISGVSNIIVISFLLLFNSQTGIHGVCYCVVFAWFVQVLVQIPFARKFGYKFSPKINLKDDNIKKVVKIAIPILLSTAVLPINNLISMKFASGISADSYSVLEYAYKLYVVIYGIFSYAIGNIIFPELSKATSTNDEENYKETLKKSLKLTAFLLIPITLGLMIYSTSIVSISYERGAFDSHSTMLTSSALFYYALGIIGAGLVEIMNKAFYAKQNTKTPLIVGICIIIINYFLCYLLSNTSLSYLGIAIATAIVAIINGLVLSLLLNKQIKIFDTKLFIFFAKLLLAGLIMTVSVVFINHITNSIFIDIDASLLINLIKLGIGAGGGAIIYFIITYLMKTNMFFERKE